MRRQSYFATLAAHICVQLNAFTSTIFSKCIVGLALNPLCPPGTIYSISNFLTLISAAPGNKSTTIGEISKLLEIFDSKVELLPQFEIQRIFSIEKGKSSKEVVAVSQAAMLKRIRSIDRYIYLLGVD